MIKNFSINNISAKGQQTIYFTIGSSSINEFMACIDSDKIRSLCEIGCINYGKKWSCPPFSPKISDLINTSDFDNVCVITAYIFLSDMYYIKNSYQRVKAANIILKSRCEQFARKLEKLTRGYALFSGSCNLCKPCNKKLDKPCKKPERRKFSLESTGVNVSLLASKFCDHELLWYKKGEDLLYTSVVTAVLYKGDLPPDLFSSIINSAKK